jgi:replicative DNA helicase
MNVHSRMAAARDLPPQRELPTQIDNEQALLGAIMTNNGVLDALPAEFSDRHFEEPLHAEIFREMTRLRANGKSITPITVKMAVANPPDMIGDMTFSQYLARMLREAVTISGAHDLAEAVMDGEQRRRLRVLSEKLDQIAFEHEMDIPDDLKAIEDQLEEIRVERSGGVHLAAGDAYLKMFEGSIAKAGVAGVPIALPEIAKVLSEPVFEAGNLYGFLSSSGEGKTSLTMQIIYHAIKNGHPTLFLSYDQSAGQCVRQMIAQEIGIEVRRQRDPHKWLKKEEQDRCLDFAMWVNRQPLEIIRCQREGVSQLIAYGRRFMKRYANGKTPLVVTDHIGKVKARDPRLSPDKISGEVTVELKSFADETGSANIILNQRNTSGTIRDNPRPISRDLYGGEGARADYDAILYLYRPEKYREERVAVAASDPDWNKINRVFGTEDRWKDIAEVGVIKSRFGDPTLREELKFEAAYTRYVSQRRAEPELF